MLRALCLACGAALVIGCASQKPKEVKQAPWTGDSGLPPPSMQQPDAASARESDVSSIRASPDTVSVPAPIPAAMPPARLEQLGEMSDSTPGAANVTQRPCDLDNCAVVLAIGTHEVAESVDQDDGGPGTYMPQGVYSAETASQPGISDAYGVQKIVRVWDISILPRGGGMQVIRQRSEPLFRVGDPVLVKGNTLLPWN